MSQPPWTLWGSLRQGINPFYRRGNCSPERWSDLPKVTQLTRAKSLTALNLTCFLCTFSLLPFLSPSEDPYLLNDSFDRPVIFSQSKSQDWPSWKQESGHTNLIGHEGPVQPKLLEARSWVKHIQPPSPQLLAHAGLTPGAQRTRSELHMWNRGDCMWILVLSFSSWVARKSPSLSDLSLLIF